MSRTFSVLCSLGDISLKWDPENDDKVLPIIQKLLDKQVRFFVLKKKDKLIPVEKVSQTADVRKVVIPDESLQDLFADGLLTIGGLLLGEPTGEIAKTPQQVAENDTVAVQPAAGG